MALNHMSCSFYSTILITLQMSVHLLRANWLCTYHKAVAVFLCVLCSGRKQGVRAIRVWPLSDHHLRLGCSQCTHRTCPKSNPSFYHHIPTIILDSSTWVKVDFSWTRQKGSSLAGSICESVLPEVLHSPLLSGHVPLPLHLGRASFLSALFPVPSPSSLYPPLFFSKEAAVGIPFPARISPDALKCSLWCQNKNLSAREPMSHPSLAFCGLSGPSVSLSLFLLGQTGVTIPTS